MQIKTQVTGNEMKFGLYLRLLYWLVHGLNDHLDRRVDKHWDANR